MKTITKTAPGMRDLTGSQLRKKNLIEKRAREVALNYGFEEINTAIIELSEVFNKSLGENSDIVGKEMYIFKDEKERSLSLRPEATASIARAIAGGLHGANIYRLPLKLFLIGPMFRKERTQKGRYRQFYQVNFESFEEDTEFSDAEIIASAYDFLSSCIDKKSFKLHINYLLSGQSKEDYKKNLIKYLKKNKKFLSQTSISRIDTNPMRIFDSKDEGDKNIMTKAPLPELTGRDKLRFDSLKDLLHNLGIDAIYDKRLVRGLDYYGGIVFEFKTDQLGPTQDAILGGGRYAGIVKNFGGKPLDGIGWAAGIDRIIEMIEQDISKEDLYPYATIVFSQTTSNNNNKKLAFKIAYELRKSQELGYIQIINSNDNSISKQLKKASKSKPYAIIRVGENIEITDRKKNLYPQLGQDPIKNDDYKRIINIIKKINIDRNVNRSETS